MDGFYSQQYELNKQLDAVEIMHVIDEYIEFHAYYYNTSIPINVISLSPHPIENYICFNHLWIKWIIDLYLYWYNILFVNKRKRQFNERSVIIMKTYSITILDQSGKKIGELMTATQTEILQFINKGFTVVDRATGSELTSNMVSSTIGVSDGLINIG